MIPRVQSNKTGCEFEEGRVREMGEDKKTPREVASHGMSEEDFRRLEELADRRYRSIFQVIVGPDTVSNQHGDNL